MDREVFDGCRVFLHMSIGFFRLAGLWLTAAVVAALSLVLAKVLELAVASFMP